MKTLQEFGAVFNAMPASKKLSMVFVLGLVVAGFAIMFFWANQIEYQLLYSNLSAEDAAGIVSKLKEQHIPYKLEGGGSVVMVQADKVYETRLALAGDGLPRGSSVGFEIFDQTSFGTTEFVQKLNYQRALQGELSRTISEIQEVDNARVLIVMPKESIFIEDTKPPSASILLKLKSRLSPDKVAGIVHIVASGVEGLLPEQVTVVDSTGRVLFKGSGKGDDAALFSSNKLDYQRQLEGKIAGRIQTMLEGIVGEGKAIVRVSADIDFDQIDYSEESYDPDSVVVRSRQRKAESSEKGVKDSTTAAVIPGQPAIAPEGVEGGVRHEKEDEVVNYEINKVTRRVVRASGTPRQLSVAAVVDGTYEEVTAEDGTKTKKFIARSPQEMQALENIVRRAMGYSEDREDQVQVSCLPLSVSTAPEEISGEEMGRDWLSYGRQYIKPAINLLLVIVVFLFVVRPLLKSIKEIPTTAGIPTAALPGTSREIGAASLPGPGAGDLRERTMMLAKDNVDRTQQVLKGWLGEK